MPSLPEDARIALAILAALEALAGVSFLLWRDLKVEAVQGIGL